MWKTVVKQSWVLSKDLRKTCAITRRTHSPLKATAARSCGKHDKEAKPENNYMPHGFRVLMQMQSAAWTGPTKSNCLLPPVVESSCSWKTPMRVRPQTSHLLTFTEQIQEVSHPHPEKNVICISCFLRIKRPTVPFTEINLHGHVISIHLIHIRRLLKMNFNW